MNLKASLRSPAMEPCLEVDDPIHQRVLGRNRLRTGQEEHCAIRDRGLRLKLVDELLELAGGSCRVLDGGQTVNYQDAGIVRLDFATQQIQHTCEPVPLQNAECADVIETVGDDSFFEKAKLPDMQQHSRMVLGQQGHVKGAAAVRDVAEADLVAEDRLPGPGRALDNE